MLATAMPDPSPLPVVGVDLGGTTVKAALVAPGFELGGRGQEPTDLRSQRALLDGIERLVDKVRDGADIAGVGFGLPSQIDQRHGRVLDSTNIPLEDLDFAEEMRRRLGADVMIDNDANVACLAEWRIGAAKGSDNVVMLTLGTGVGGGLILDGRPYRGSTGAGAELGHMTIDADGPPCQGHCPNRGCLEVLASATGIMREANTLADARPAGTLREARGGGAVLDARFVIEHARIGDAESLQVLETVGHNLGIGIANLVNIFNPDVVVIGGGVSAAGELLLTPAREEYRRRALPSLVHHTEIVAASLGNDAGVLGAAALVL
jgi:glucokinase